MPQLAILSIVGAVLAAVLTVVFLRMRQQDLLGALIEKRRPTSKLATRANFVEGAESMPVALSLSGDVLYYENPDLEASFELDRIDEIEYDDELTTGKNLDANHRVLRLRSHGRSFEFVLDKTDHPKWATALPARTMGTTHAHAV